MSSCPSCNKATDPEAAVCDCGELLRADVTNVGGWETETMFAEPRTVNNYRIAAIATILVIVSTLLAVSWPQLQQRFLGTSESTIDLSTSNVSQNPLRSDIDPTEEPDDMITTESQQGAFEFSPGEQRPEISTRASLNLSGHSTAGSQHPTTDVVGGSNPLDARLLADNAAAQNLKNGNAAPDCKPEITLDLKRPDPPAAVAELKLAAKSADAKTYTLGPRGGCFYVTSSGSKKYVDHSMCGQTAVAAARQ
jgi:hypothetical protein